MFFPTPYLLFTPMRSSAALFMRTTSSFWSTLMTPSAMDLSVTSRFSLVLLSSSRILSLSFSARRRSVRSLPMMKYASFPSKVRGVMLSSTSKTDWLECISLPSPSCTLPPSKAVWGVFQSQGASRTSTIFILFRS